MRVEQAQIVKAPRELVFQAWTDYEAWPRFSGLFTRVSVKERAGNTVHVDAETKVLGRTIARSEKHVLTPPEQVRVEARRKVRPTQPYGHSSRYPRGPV